MTAPSVPSPIDITSPKSDSHFRFHLPYRHLTSVYGDSWFALKAEAFARFFGTPVFIAVQTMIVLSWIVLNAVGVLKFDLYPFILLNLAFSLQSAYAAPLILLAQTRQADRDKASVEADAKHREALAMDSLRRQEMAAEQTARMTELLEQNTSLTARTEELSRSIEALTRELHATMCHKGA